MSTGSYDALRFKAKRDCYFCGIGSLKQYESKPFKFEMKFRVLRDGEDVEPIIIEVDSQTSPENEEKMHWFDIQDYGQQPILCEEGMFVEVGLKLHPDS